LVGAKDRGVAPGVRDEAVAPTDQQVEHPAQLAAWARGCDPLQIAQVGLDRLLSQGAGSRAARWRYAPP